MAKRKRKSTRRKPPARGLRAARAHGKRQAQRIIQERARAAPRRPRPSQGLLIAEGDSWFDYPFNDTLEMLEDKFHYEVESVAHRGDTLEEMAYDAVQLSKLARRFQKLSAKQREPRAILLSGGGNDIAGQEFGFLLNHIESGLPPLNKGIMSGLFEQRLRFGCVSLMTAVGELSKQYFGRKLPILIHGYDYAVPDGRGYAGGFWILPGPWLEPGFRQKGYEEVEDRIPIMADLIDHMNDMLADLSSGTGMTHVHYVNLRGTLSNKLPKEYKKWWNDELHPTKKGFREVAHRFDEALKEHTSLP